MKKVYESATVTHGQNTTKELLFKTTDGTLHRASLKYDGAYPFQSSAKVCRMTTNGFDTLMWIQPQAELGITNDGKSVYELSEASVQRIMDTLTQIAEAA